MNFTHPLENHKSRLTIYVLFFPTYYLYQPRKCVARYIGFLSIGEIFSEKRKKNFKNTFSI